MYSFQDVNGDGLPDMVLHIQTRAMQLMAGNLEAELRGETIGGIPINGRDSIRIVP